MLQLPWPVYFFITAVVVAAFFVLAFLTKIFSSSGESYVLYRHLLFSIACVSLALSLAGRPLFPYLDIYCISFGVFHMFGRIGCYRTGCCHGRPYYRGIIYKTDSHAGLPLHYVNVKLFPAQPVEASGIFIITVSCLLLFLSGAYKPGTTFVVYLSFYAGLRYLLEFFRGDTDRFYLAGFSEAQWTSVTLLLFITILSFAGLLPYNYLSMLICLFCTCNMVAVYALRQVSPQRNISNPFHLREMAIYLKSKTAGVSQGLSLVYSTSEGINFSLSYDKTDSQKWLCTLSYKGKADSQAAIRYAFRQMRLIHFGSSPVNETAGKNGIVHFSGRIEK